MEGTIAPEQIIINGQEFSSEDASRYIDLGRKYSEMESKLNTSLDKVYPEYTKATQRLKELETDNAEKARLLEELQTKKPAIPEDRAQAIKAAREMGLADQDYLKEKGYMTRAEMDSYYTEKQNQQKLVENVLNQADTLAKEIDGSDGRAAFNKKAVLAYAAQYQISDLKEAYEEMYEPNNKAWKDAQIAKASRPGLTTLKPGGTKQPVKTKVSDDNFKALWDEMYGGTE